jgi:uncharacterized protein (TIGR02145 family)
MGHQSKSTINHKRLDVLRLFLTLILFSFISLGGYALHPFDELTGAESIDGSLMLSTNTTGTDYYVSVSNSSALSMDVNAVASGTYASVKDTVTTRTNIGGGYDLYVSMGNSNSNLYLTSDNQSYIAPTSATIDSPAVLDSNSWGFAVPTSNTGAVISGFDSSYSTPTPSAASKWAAMPVNTEATKVQSTNAANETGQALDIYYGAYLDITKPGGTYSGEVIYSAVGDLATSTQGPATVSPTSMYQGVATELTITTSLSTSLIDSALGTVSVMLGSTACLNPTSDTTSGTLIVTCTAPATMSTLGSYDVTVSVERYGTTYYSQNGLTVIQDPLDTITTMQAMTSTLCGNAPTYEQTGKTYTLTDTRGDGAGHTQTYAVRKLKDGNCWMVQNLNLTLSTSMTLTPDDTNITSNFTPTNNTDTTATSWGSYDTATDVDKTRSYEPGDKWCTGTTAGSSQTCSTTQGTADATAHIGNYYNWSAATAGSGTSAMDSGNASYSICPKGWRLPTGGSSGELANLITTTYDIDNSGAGSATLRSAPLSFISGGYYSYSGYAGGTNISGNYWSSTACRSFGKLPNAHALEFTQLVVYPGNGVTKASGYSVRCVSQ